MTGHNFVQRVNDRCAALLDSKRAQVAEISEDAVPLADSLAVLAAGGKKLRPMLAWLGWRAAGGLDEAEAPEYLGAALELFQAAALVHDDVIDRSATRRGQPSTHRRFEALHAQRGFTGDTAHFGVTGAILAGDLALSWASDAFDLADEAVAQPRPAARRRFRQMHTQVIAGQYLDVHAEVAPAPSEESAALRSARSVLTYKSAKYSTEHPIALGGALAGADEDLLEALAAAALPVGVAFQLRDDLLGVFGDPELTGKPVGDDLREGKRTELIAYGLFRSDPAASSRLAGMLGQPELDETDVSVAREILHDSGAVAAVEADIEVLVGQSKAAEERLARRGVASAVLTDFAAVRRQLVARTS